MPDPKHVKPPSERRRVRVILTVWYLVALAGAGWGSYSGLITLGLPHPLAVAIVAALELGAIVFTTLADYRRRLGETALAARVMAAAVAGFAIWVNWAGHHAFWKVFFAGFSVAGFVVVLIDSGMRRRDRRYDETGSYPVPPPEYGIIQWITAPKLTALARDLALRDDQLTARASLAKAQAERDSRARRRAIYGVCHEHLTGAFGPAMAQLIATVADPERLAAEVERLIDWPSFAKVIADRVDPDQLERAMAREERERRAADGGPGPMQRGSARPSAQPMQRGRARASAQPARGRARTTTATSAQPPVHTPHADAQAASAQAAPHSPAPPVHTPRAQASAWPAARETAYLNLYAAELNRAGQEVSSSRLAAALGVDASTANRARSGAMRDRYAREFLDGVQTPAEGVRLAPAVQERIAKVSAERTATGEFQRITAHTPDTTTGDTPA